MPAKIKPSRRKTTRKPARAKTSPSTSSPAEIRPTERQVTVASAKGRPMLTWVGKQALRHVPAFPAQHIETFDPMGDAAKHGGKLWTDGWKKYPKGGLLFHGDNKEVLAHLLANGFREKVKLIYIDPPFDSGADYVRRVTLRGPSGTAKISGERYALGEQIQYTDIWANDTYLQFMYERLLLLKELLAEGGSVYLHCDDRKIHHLRCIMDEIFGPENLQNEIVWFFPGGGDSERQFNRNHNTILFYTKGPGWTFNYEEVLIPYTKEQLDRFDQQDENGKYYWNVNPRGERGKTYLRKKGIGEYDVWTIGINASEAKTFGYPTLKPSKLLERIIRASSKSGDVVLDCFIGSGTTAAVAQKMGRSWIGCDINKGAIQTTSRRLQTIIQEQIADGKKRGPQLVSTEQDKPQPAQLSFAVLRVNDYDLQIQHNEAVNMVSEHIGVERTRTDRYFDGTLGKRLVKITPFGHPLTPLDLEELKRELQARPDEERDVVVICLGKELAVEQSLEEWNRLRKKGDVPNKIEVIELRTDPKYGKFIAHKPALGRVQIKRAKDKLLVEIQDFISPTIIERLKEQAGILTPQIEDWRAMVDSVMIDPDYNGKVFNIALSDVPERKTDLVSGRYEMPSPKGKAIVAVKITDMLGEEVLVIQTV